MRHIISLLLSFADLAEQASVRSWRVRRDLLAILRRAETAAFWTVANAARDRGAPLPAAAVAAGRHWKFDDDGDDPENALRLAHRFRALAVALSFLLAREETQASKICKFGRVVREKAETFNTHCLSHTRRIAVLRLAAIRAPPLQAV